MSVASWSVREPTDSECEEDNNNSSSDECVIEKDNVQERYESIQENLRQLRVELESSLAE